MIEKTEMPPVQKEELLQVLKTRFEKNRKRHSGINWADVQAKLEADPAKWWVLQRMESTGGEPDVIFWKETENRYGFCDCAAETPAGRRSLCYDRAGWEMRKEHRPAGNAIDQAAEIGIDLLTQDEYERLQELGAFDTKTSSWLKTPEAVRKVGGAIFGDRRYGRVFRGVLWV